MNNIILGFWIVVGLLVLMVVGPIIGSILQFLATFCIGPLIVLWLIGMIANSIRKEVGL